MDDGITLPANTLDVPTLAFVAVCLAATLGVFLIVTWLQQRSVRAFAWWGSAYLIGASSMALWSAPTPIVRLPGEIPGALMFFACGMIWNGVRVFQGRRLLPAAAFAGAIVWLVGVQLPLFAEGGVARIALGAAVVAAYTYAIAHELRRERRKQRQSRTAAFIVPSLHAGIFLLPLAMRAFLPRVLAESWITVFALESIIYAVGLAFIVLAMVKDHHVYIYRNAATIDPLTELFNRRAFYEGATSLCAEQAKCGEPVSMLMFDLDHFKSINDRFGHAVGDVALQTFAQVARNGMREGDIVARLGGEEFVAIVPAPADTACRIAERLRTAFQAAGVVIAGRAMGATVSIGVATSHVPVTDVDRLMERADAALYRAKRGGRNRVQADDGEAAMPAEVDAPRLVPVASPSLVPACAGEDAGSD